LVYVFYLLRFLCFFTRTNTHTLHPLPSPHTQLWISGVVNIYVYAM
jgi:hypothetical protein